ncbi:ABC transporter ATP-binding protein [Streptomyces endophyticus]|uniref:ABC transporter ATP-binding protein n=1 Tax=Streptomyces endophyticus TaxID=714166 RepID=A0ABU6F198_9ACTN|nr:ABC transporter ATP-binding protein [Streptomyces endophyticus]MEB8337754.1 ABC transporter ATP-binding protein [Streptomyces endophyticus]
MTETDLNTPAVPGPARRHTDTDTLLEVRGLKTEFATAGGRVAAVRDVSFSVRRRQRLAIVGESGSGKSAMAMSIVGLVQSPGRVTGGEILLEGRNLRGLPDKEMSRIRGRRISLVFQDPMSAFDPIRTIGSQLVESIRAHQPVSRRVARRQAADLLGEVGVADPEHRLSDHPHQYSGGMRQRVLIAMALANSPELVIADEPTTALDVTTQAQVLGLLDRLVTDRGAALMLITHNLGIVAGFCDSVQVMYAGQLIEESPSRELFRSAAHPYSRQLLDCVLRTDRRQQGPLATIPGALPDPTSPPHGCAFEPRCPRGKGNSLCKSTEPELVQVGARGDGHGGRQLAKCHFPGVHEREETT